MAALTTNARDVRFTDGPSSASPALRGTGHVRADASCRRCTGEAEQHADQRRLAGAVQFPTSESGAARDSQVDLVTVTRSPRRFVKPDVRRHRACASDSPQMRTNLCRAAVTVPPARAARGRAAVTDARCPPRAASSRRCRARTRQVHEDGADAGSARAPPPERAWAGRRHGSHRDRRCPLDRG